MYIANIKDRNIDEITIFRMIWTAIFISSTATFLILLSLSSYVVTHGGSWFFSKFGCPNAMDTRSPLLFP